MGFSRREYWSEVPLPSLYVGLQNNILFYCCVNLSLFIVRLLVSLNILGKKKIVKTSLGLEDYKEELYDTYLITHNVSQWHPTPVLLPGKSHGRRSLVGCSP